MSNFQVLNVSIEMVESVHQLMPLLKSANPNLADQISRASMLVPLNIAEANQRTGRDRANRFRIAKGEAAEVVACLRVAVACRMMKLEVAEGALELADRVSAMLYRLIR